MTTSSSRLTCATLALAWGLCAPPASAQPQVLFADDFAFQNDDNWFPMPRPWRVAADGECGISSGMAVSNDPATCSYGAGTAYTATLVSRPFVLTGTPPYTLSFEHMIDFDESDAVGDMASFAIVRANPPSAIFLGTWDVDDDTDEPMTMTQSFNASWEGAYVTLQWTFRADGERDDGMGWLLDDVLFTNSGGWTDLGGGLAGVAGVPSLMGNGTLEAGSDTLIELAHGHPFAGAVLVVGLTQLDAPFKGGVLVPSPDLLIPLTIDHAGAFELGFVFPAGVPAATELSLQCWIEQPSFPPSWAGSNGLKAWTL